MRMTGTGISDLSSFDLAALAAFLLTWVGYGAAVERFSRRGNSLNRIMNRYRHAWTEQLAARELRVVDTLVNASLQNGTAFFASTSLIALGSVLTLTRSTDEVLTLFSTLPLGIQTTRTTWEIKLAGLALIFAYAFFKFAWSYRLFTYVAILIGAVPPCDGEPDEIRRAARRVGAMNVVAGRHFNRGMYALFFALAYLGWFVGPHVLLMTTASVLVVMWRRQFSSSARDALQDM